MEEHLKQIKVFSENKSNRVPFIKLYNRGENLEAGINSGNPKLNRDGSFDTHMLDMYRSIFFVK
jgi:hypothetical protein